VRKRSGSNMSFLCESEAAATCLFCAKAKRQQHVFFVRKRSGSNKHVTDKSLFFSIMACSLKR
ncbi:hypothetical protein ACIQYL_09465, partial [Lysinibacillus xylanilyticus]|uniref:hypothetical protein n=1 Tax=Lysinibacillus xylanilyticus TaxID=582475 RepID=UPI0037FDBA19